LIQFFIIYVPSQQPQGHNNRVNLNEVHYQDHLSVAQGTRVVLCVCVFVFLASGLCLKQLCRFSVMAQKARILICAAVGVWPLLKCPTLAINVLLFLVTFTENTPDAGRGQEVACC
jgi:hypothetical protein